MRVLAPADQERRVYGGRLQFGVLGPLEVGAGSGAIPLGGPKQRAVLAHLLIRANEVVPAESLIDEIWGDEPPERVRNVVQTYVSHLRKALGPDRIESHAPGYRLRVEASELDAARFEALVREAKKSLPVDPTIAVGTLDDALSLWRGPALADLEDQPSLLAEAARLNDLRLDAEEDRVRGLLASGSQAMAIGELEVLLGRNALRESLWGLLMLAHYREGRQADALAAYQRARETLADDLGIDPSPELVRLHERILRQDPGLDLRGQALRAYRLLEKISEGPRGVVFRAIQPRVERDVAVKIFQEAIAADASFVRRFEREAQAVAVLEHPHIVPIYDYWREPGRAYIVSRYLRGASLRALQERGHSVEPDRALRVIHQIASALAFAHRQGVAHGRVGPSNVLFDGEGNAYIGDFLVGVGPVPDGPSDVRHLARLARDLLADGMPERLRALVEEADLGKEAPRAEEFARAARAAFEPTPVGEAPLRDDVRNPYKGLRPFTEADARDFFGRGELTQRLVGRLRGEEVGSRFLAVVGPSGSGKSSVVRAGLVPAIRHGALGDPERSFVAEMSPGAHPIDELEAALLRMAVRPVSRLHETLEDGSRGLLQAVDLLTPPGAEVVLVVDQFEEVFTLSSDEREREHFLESLRVATGDPDSRLRVVVTLRADFYDRPLTYPRFAHLLAATTEAVPPLTPDELEQAIRKPAQQVGVSPEPGLIAEMIADVAHQPGALPLLQYALTELFERRDDDQLTLRAYQQIGGVAGALSARADRNLEAADPDGRRAIKQVFLRLVTLGEGTQDTRRRVVRSELDALDVKYEAIDGVLDAFGHHRLLTFDRDPSTREPTVEIAHEALLTAWARLRGWIDDTREDLRQERRLARGAAEWQASDRDPSFLMRGARLEQVASWQETTDLALGERERAYLKVSLDERDRERAEADERRRREARLERRSRTRLRALVAVFAVATLVTGSLTVVATNQRERASRQARLATARGFASAALANLELDPERSVLLAMAAIDQTRSVDGTVLPEAVEALHRAITASRAVSTFPGLGGALDWSPKGVFVTEGAEGSGMIEIRDEATGYPVRSFPGHDGDVTDVDFSWDGSELATTGDDGMLKVWNPSNGDLVASISAEGTPSGLSFSADGSLVAAVWIEAIHRRTRTSPTVRVVDVSTIRVLDLSKDRVVWTDVVRGSPADTALSPSGERLAVIHRPKRGVVFDLNAGDRSLRLQTGENDLHLAWSPDGRYIATTSAVAAPRVWDAETGEALDRLTGHAGIATSVAWSPDSSRLVTAGREVKVWDVGADIEEVRSLSAPEISSGVAGVAFSGDGTRLMAGATDLTAVKVWSLDRNGDAEWADLPSSRLAEFLPGHRLVATSRRGTALTIWDVQRRTKLRTIGPIRMGVYGLDVSPDGRDIAAAVGWTPPRQYGGHVARVWNAATGQELFSVWHRFDGWDVDFSPDGKHMVTAGWTGWVKVVDREGHLLQRFHEKPDRKARDNFVIWDVSFSWDGRLVATANNRGFEPGGLHVEIWDWQKAMLVRKIDGATLVEFDPTGLRLVTVAAGRAEIHDPQSGARLTVLAAPSRDISAVTYSPDGSVIATGHEDGAVRLFEADTGNQCLALPGNCGTVDDVSFSPDGTMLASASACDGVRVWALDIRDLLEIARHSVSGTVTNEECLQYLHKDQCPPS